MLPLNLTPVVIGIKSQSQDQHQVFEELEESILSLFYDHDFMRFNISQVNIQQFSLLGKRF